MKQEWKLSVRACDITMREKRRRYSEWCRSGVMSFWCQAIIIKYWPNVLDCGKCSFFTGQTKVTDQRIKEGGARNKDRGDRNQHGDAETRRHGGQHECKVQNEKLKVEKGQRKDMIKGK